MHDQLPAEVQAQLNKSQQHYQQHARLRLSVDTLGADKLAWCSAHQYEPAVNGLVLSEAEILVRATEAFAPLGTAGFTPVISICAFEKGTPAKPIVKHRMVEGLVVGGRLAAVLRQSPPRMLFAAEGGTLSCVAAEVPTTEQKTAALVYKALQWWKRAPHRR